MAFPIPQLTRRSRADVAYSIWWNTRLHPVNQQREHEHLSMLRHERREQWERRYPGPFEDDDNDSVFDVEDWPLPPLTSLAQTAHVAPPQALIPTSVAPLSSMRSGDNTIVGHPAGLARSPPSLVPYLAQAQGLDDGSQSVGSGSGIGTNILTTPPVSALRKGKGRVPPESSTNTAWMAFLNGAPDAQNSTMCKHCDHYRQGKTHCRGGAPCYMCWYRGFDADECRRTEFEVRKREPRRKEGSGNNCCPTGKKGGMGRKGGFGDDAGAGPGLAT